MIKFITIKKGKGENGEMKRKNIGIFTGVLLSAFAALNLNAAAIKTGTSAPKMKPVLTVE